MTREIGNYFEMNEKKKSTFLLFKIKILTCTSVEIHIFSSSYSSASWIPYSLRMLALLQSLDSMSTAVLLLELCTQPLLVWSCQSNQVVQIPFFQFHWTNIYRFQRSCSWKHGGEFMGQQQTGSSYITLTLTWMKIFSKLLPSCPTWGVLIYLCPTF